MRILFQKLICFIANHLLTLDELRALHVVAWLVVVSMKILYEYFLYVFSLDRLSVFVFAQKNG